MMTSKHRFASWQCAVILCMFSAFADATFGQLAYYVRAGATGASSGADWNNAFSNLPSSLIRGATYYVADGSYGAYTFDDAANGVLVITIKKATALDHGTDVGWSDSYGDGAAVWIGWEVVRPYYVFDGVTRGADWRSGYGFRVITGGKYGVNLFYGGSSTAQYITIRYTEVQGQGLDNSVHDDGIYSPSGCHHVKIQSCFVHDVGRAPILTGFSLDWLIEYSLIARNSSDASIHSEGLASTADSGFVVRHNIFEDIEGTGFIVCLNRGSGINICSNWEIYGNVFMYSEGNPYNREGVGDGAIAVINQQVAQNWKVYNNSFINIGQGPVGIASRVIVGGDGQTGNTNVQVYNNFWWRSDVANNVLSGCASCESRWNRYDQTTHYTEADQQDNVVASTSVFVNYASKNFHLTAPSLGGTTLASLYSFDMNGNVRGLDGVWDRGAYEFVGGSNAPPPAFSGQYILSTGSNGTPSVMSPINYRKESLR